jgi:hypothetical protein
MNYLGRDIQPGEVVVVRGEPFVCESGGGMSTDPKSGGVIEGHWLRGDVPDTILVYNINEEDTRAYHEGQRKERERIAKWNAAARGFGAQP